MPMLLNQNGWKILAQSGVDMVDGAVASTAAAGADAVGTSVSEGLSLNDGAVVAIVGLMIVFTALILITLFISALPKILEKISRVWPEVDEPVGHPTHSDSLLADDGAVLAAIGFVLHTEFQRQLESQDSSRQSS